jgi:hypothetical protein
MGIHIYKILYQDAYAHTSFLFQKKATGVADVVYVNNVT